ncbi:MAG TPA: ATP-binding protein [Candidatus Binatia bacterium]|nr:ATP-binding protein [Candidatus Binatia bacterium]
MDPIHSKDGERTLPLTVKNTGFLLERLGKDCHPLQFLRELTQNSVEAILRTKERTGEIIWDVDWTSYELGDYGAYKLCVIDNGDGMTGEEMVRYINQLSSSLADQSFDGNYGIGAKISAATRNPAGLIYMSWKNGRGSMIHLWKNSTGQYGLRQIERPDGSFGHFGELETGVKPDVIADHGTVVILLGESIDSDTMKAPESAPAPSRWIAKYLNSRYFRVPGGVSIRAREGWEHPRSDKDRNLLRKITGQEEYLRNHSTAFGVVELNEAQAHWWVLKNESALTQNSGFIESSGHAAALYRDELYELTTARAGRARLQNFGVLLGHNRVVIYVEPEPTTGRRITTNTARTHLLIDSEPLPWADYAADFREQIPEEIKELMDEVAAGSSVSDHTKSIRERLKSIMDLFKVSRYRPTPSGELMIDEQRTRGGRSRNENETTRAGSRGRSGTIGGAAGGVYSVFLKKDGIPGTAVHPDIFPSVQWVSVKDGTRNPGDIEDRAARFLLDQNVLQINADFRVFTDMISYWSREMGSKTAVSEIVQDAVRGWFEQALIETVIGVQALKDAKEWSVDDIEKALSEEALTSAVMQRYHVNNAVKRELGSKLGKLNAA